MNNYFAFNDNVILVKGYKRALIQDLIKGRIFSINEDSKIILEQLLQGKSINEVVNNEKRITGFYGKEKELTKKIDTAWLELRRACNLNCCHCYLDCNIDGDKNLELMTIDNWEKVIIQLKALKVKTIILIGGEPLLFREINELLKYCKETIPKVTLVLYSNLTLLNKNHVKAIKETNTKVITSIYSKDPKVHDSITGVNGSFYKTVNSVKLLTNEEIFVKANTVLMNKNEYNIEETLQFTYELTGVKSKIDKVRDVGQSKISLSPINKIDTNFNIKGIKENEFLRNYSGNSCLQGKINICCNGDVTPCIMGDTFKSLDLNVKNNSIMEIVQKYLIPQFWRLSKDKIEKCKDCEYRYVCKDCRPTAVNKKNICNYNPYKGEYENIKPSMN